MQEGELQEVIIKKVGVFSFAGIFALFSFVAGIIFAMILVFSVSTAVSLYPAISTYVEQYSPSNALLFVSLPLTFAVLGFLTGILSALIYNFVSRFIGVKIYS